MSVQIKPHELAIIDENMKLVPIIVGAYRNRQKNNIMDFDEMCSVGYLTLCKCARNYDSGIAQFNSYLTKAIGNEVKKEEDKRIKNLEKIAENESCDFNYFLQGYAEEGIIDDDFAEIEAQDSRRWLAELLTPFVCRHNTKTDAKQVNLYEVFSLLECGYSHSKIDRMLNLPNLTTNTIVRKTRNICTNNPKLFTDSPFEVMINLRNKNQKQNG